MGEGTTNTAAVQVDDAILLAAGKDDAPAKSIRALRINQARFKDPLKRVAEALQISAHTAATSVTNAELLDELRIMYAALGQIVHALTMTMQFELVEAGGTSEQLRSGSEFLRQVDDTLAKGEMARQFDKANQVAAAPTAVTIEQVFLSIDVERGMGLLMQRAESDELRPGADLLAFPLVPVQVFEQRNMLFEPFEVLAHGGHTPRSVRLEAHTSTSQPTMVGERGKSWVFSDAEARAKRLADKDRA